MTSAVNSTNPLQHLSCCDLLAQGEFLEVICRIANAVADVFMRIGQMIVDGVKGCFEFAENNYIRDQYLMLPLRSPDFENKALEMACKYLSADEMQSMQDLDEDGPRLFSQAIVRAAIFGMMLPECIAKVDPLTNCELCHHFNNLSFSDQKAIILHFDSDLIPIKMNQTITGYRLSHQPTPGKMARRWIPYAMSISTEARNFYVRYRGFALNMLQGQNSILHAAQNVTWPE